MKIADCVGAASDDALTGRLLELRGEERAVLVEFLIILGELDRGEVVVGLGFSSSFDFLVRHCARHDAYRAREDGISRAAS